MVYDNNKRTSKGEFIMVYVLSRVIIFVVWIINWVVIKTRLIIPALFILIVRSFFQEWYCMNVALVYTIFSLVVLVVLISWIVTLINTIKSKKRWHKRDIAYAYRIAGEPIRLQDIPVLFTTDKIEKDRLLDENGVYKLDAKCNQLNDKEDFSSLSAYMKRRKFD